MFFCESQERPLFSEPVCSVTFIGKERDIKKIIKPKDKLLVQVKKDSNEKKGAKVSTHISLPSKYIVLMPNTDIITVSQKIENEKEQQRLIKLVQENISKGNEVK